MNKTDRKGRQGYWELFYQVSGNISFKGHYVDGKREGLWISYYDNGDTLKRAVFENDIEVETLFYLWSKVAGDSAGDCFVDDKKVEPTNNSILEPGASFKTIYDINCNHKNPVVNLKFSEGYCGIVAEICDDVFFRDTKGFVHAIKFTNLEIKEIPVEKKENTEKVKKEVVFEKPVEKDWTPEGCEKRSYKAAANFMIGPVREWMKKSGYLTENSCHMNKFKVYPDKLRSLINIVEFTDTLSFNDAKSKVLPEMILNMDEEPWDIINRLGLVSNNDTDEIKKMALEVIAKFPEKEAEYKSGKTSLIGFFVGELIRHAGKGKVNPKIANEVLREVLQ